MKSKQEIKKNFENGDIPVQEDFWEWQDSYWHKDENIPQDNISGLKETLKTKLNAPDPSLGSGFYFLTQNSPWTTYQKINLTSYYLTSWNGSNFVSSNIYYNNGKVGIGTTQLLTETFEVDGNIKTSGLIISNLGYTPTIPGQIKKYVVARQDGSLGWDTQPTDSQEHIPLAGTTDDKPLRGSIQYKGNDTTGQNSFGFYSKHSNNEMAGFDIQDDGALTPSIYWIGGDNVTSVLSINHDDVIIGSSNPAFSGLRGSTYYGDYYTNESFIQKKYADKQHSYTTKEELTGGSWINGKPIYKKTLFFNQIPRNGEIWIDKLIENMEVIVSNQMFTEWYAIDAAFAGNQWRSKAFITLEKTHVQFEIIGAPDNDYSTIDSFTLTLEYTKK
ncbi:hypothetical protein [Chryseobacterium sp. ERMR1:04]|uniref:hypothetical protein n=1 Tax=Chryseobacterium sp. ERMR1:04 TaxID=1705393 RepID=UPI0006C84BF6|nr:hypothetical protein [Chryseobacterium sp. ERMR1:04]KPH11591.1 hypothetical protein AMQ68_19555 [Chryseobacterium sp. ERMR1:04]